MPRRSHAPSPAGRAGPRGRQGALLLRTCLFLPVLTCSSQALAAPPDPSVAARRDACLARNEGAPERYHKLVRAFCAEHARLAGTGAALAVGERGALRFVATAGDACRGGPEVDADTRFRLGSITKLLTAALALTLVDDDLLDLDAPVAPLVPELAGEDPRASAITLRQLLQHTAGLPDPPPQALGADDDWPMQLGAAPLWSDPGALWSYSSAGYALAGLALERRTDVPFASLLTDRLLAPLGLGRVTVDLDMALQTGAACGHLGRGDAARELDVVQDLELGAGGARWTIPAGGAIASAPDLTRAALALVDPVRSPLSAAAIAGLIDPDVPTRERPGERYGLGLRAAPVVGDVRLLAHAGDTGDFAADLYLAPDRGFALAILNNGGDHLQATALAALADLLGVSPAPPGPRAPSNLYVGTYDVPGQATPLRVEATGDVLTLRAPDQGLDAELVHLGDHRFRAATRPVTFVFTADTQRASHLRARDFLGARRP